MMRRKAFILAELLTGMMIQAWFIVTLCGAFYLLLTFSNRIQQSNAAQDHGQRVIAYVDARIRNAGLGLWGCEDSMGKTTPQSISFLLGENNILRLKNLDLPVAITSGDTDEDHVLHISHDRAGDYDGIYRGNVLTLLYAHRDYNSVNKNNSKLLVSLEGDAQSIDISSAKLFNLIGQTALESWTTIQNSSFANTGDTPNIKNYAVIEPSGVPVRLKADNQGVKITPLSLPTRIYNMSELLNLECERMFVTESTGQRSFMVKSLGFENNQSVWNPASPHTAGILELYMELDTKPKVPVFTLKVLVNEGKADTPTHRPSDWPPEYWRREFEKYNVHISRASWKLYNLAPITYAQRH